MEKLGNVIALSLTAPFKNCPKESFYFRIYYEDNSNPFQKSKKKNRLMEKLFCI